MSKFLELIHKDRLVLIDFYATWCGPCKMMTPILKEVKDNVGEQATIIKIDVDKNQYLANQYKIKGVPTLLLFKKGELLWRQSGVVQKQQLIDLIQTYK